MIRKVTALVALVLLLALSASSAFAAETPAAAADECAMESMSAEAMIADIQTWTAGLPTAVSKKIMQIVRPLSPDKLMLVHRAFHHTDLLQQSPGQILSNVQSLVR